MTEQMSSPEQFFYRFTVGWLVSKAVSENYITLDEADLIHTTQDAVWAIEASAIRAGEDPQDVFKKWGVLDRALEYLNKTE